MCAHQTYIYILFVSSFWKDGLFYKKKHQNVLNFFSQVPLYMGSWKTLRELNFFYEYTVGPQTVFSQPALSGP